jgi:hypothetical protein
MFRKLLISVVFAFFPVASFAASESSFDTKIERISTYADYGDGDVAFWLDNNSEKSCYGYWMSPTSKGFDANFSTLLSAFHANSNLIVYGKLGAENKWTGSSSSHYCKVESIVLKK